MNRLVRDRLVATLGSRRYIVWLLDLNGSDNGVRPTFEARTKASTEMTKRFFSGLLVATLAVAPLSGIVGCEKETEPVETTPVAPATTDVEPVETE